MSEAPIVFSFIADLPLAGMALDYAHAVHLGQRRASDDAPFILHPLEVASLLLNTGHREAVVAAGILHDTIENSPTRSADLAARFGGEVAALVSAVSEDPEIEPFEARKQALRKQIADFGDDAIAIDAADKVTKVRELRARAAQDPARLDEQSAELRPRLEHYVASLAMLEQAQGDHPLVRQLRFELEALRALPPRAAGISSEDVPLQAP